ncbi:hypothetical protein C1T17_10450 [Sphingobium sp. SCG-1]|uniref:hypothetical protein n=1 Tax=Sphingobium sp. SCG-1 TaxID=2072936 RepID=UPI000CD6A6A5|nr:hypothetical protein [Sphingobium sp. SCG-1]AUW58461.1 hypothetical protein C1T17_10450 [Sphingobium sp. SCG-1]
MSFAAVICASHSTTVVPPMAGAGTELRAGLHFAGHSLVEYQARQAAEAGASHVMILVGAVTQPLSRAVDRLTADGIPVMLVRDMVSLVREAPRDRDMMLIADGAIIAQKHITAVSAHPGNVLLAADDSRATAGFERIDGQHRWAGLLRVSPDLLFGTLDMLGDWDLELTLMRAAVQAGGYRIVVPQEDILEGRIALVDSQASADLVAQALLGGQSEAPSTEGGAEHYLLSRIATRIAPMLLRTQVPATQVRIGGIALSAMGVIAVMLAWPLFGMLLMLCGLTTSLTSDRLGQLARRAQDDGWMALMPGLIVLLGVIMLGDEAGARMDGIYLALLLGIVLLAVRWRRTGGIKPWALFTPGSALILLIIVAFLSSVTAGLALGNLCGIGSVAMMVLRRRA